MSKPITIGCSNDLRNHLGDLKVDFVSHMSIEELANEIINKWEIEFEWNPSFTNQQ